MVYIRYKKIYSIPVVLKFYGGLRTKCLKILLGEVIMKNRPKN